MPAAVRLGPLGRYLLPLGLALAVAAGLYALGTANASHLTAAQFDQTLTDTVPLKSWLATALLALAATQLGLALWIYDRLPGLVAAGRSVVTVHRAVGGVAILLTLVIAYRCASTYGVQTGISARVAVHSVAGCFLFGAIVAKLVIVRLGRFRGWVVPLAGGTLVVLVAVLWYTSALWYFNDFSLPAL
jgi:hypothetical protein